MPRLLDLYCGEGGWTVAAARRNWTCIGIDNIPQPRYPGRQVIQSLPDDIATLVARFYPDAITASPPCEEYARHHLPWLKGPPPDKSHMKWCRALIEHAPCPVIVECSRFASWHFPGSSRCGSLHLWGAVPTLLPECPPHKMKTDGRYPGRRAVIPLALADRFFEEVESRLVSR